MLEAYSVNLNVGENVAIPLNNVHISKGCTAVLSAPATIQLNKSGVYCVSLDASGEAQAAGDIVSQMTKNGVLQPQAQSTATGVTGEIDTLGFKTLVQVSTNNSCRCCDSPTVLQFMNTGVETTYTNVNVVVTKVC